MNSITNNKFFNPGYLFDRIAPFLVKASGFILSPNFRTILHGIFLFLTFFFTTLIGYCLVRIFEIRKKEHAHLHHEIAEYAHHQAEKEQKLKEKEAVSTNPRWIQVLDYLSSDNANDWRLAIIEADSMLESLMDDLGFKGESLGDKLKAADRDKFKNLSAAWEVHTVRNRIAHEGSDFDLSLREAKRVAALYEQIFREFGYI